jgi:hypothetical protein
LVYYQDAATPTSSNAMEREPAAVWMVRPGRWVEFHLSTAAWSGSVASVK